MQYRVIREKSKWRRWLAPTLALIACLISGVVGLLWGASIAQSQIEENVALQERVEELTATNTGLRGRLTDSELIIDTQRYTAVALRDELTQLHKHMASLEAELGFFRKIMVPDSDQQGLQVERFSVTSEGGSAFVIRATLIHVSERTRVVSGTVNIEVEGAQGGSPVTLSGGALASSPEELKFRFRYFQELEQRVVLPQDFVATTVKMAMIGKNTTPVDAEFVWAAE